MKSGVKNSSFFLLFITDHIFTRPYCILEIETAIENNKPLILLWDRNTKNYSRLTWDEIMDTCKVKEIKDYINKFKVVNLVEFKRRGEDNNEMYKQLLTIMNQEIPEEITKYIKKLIQI